MNLSNNRPTVAFIGLGAMGSGMAANLHRAGFPLRVWNRNPARSQAFAAACLEGTAVTICADPAAAAREAQVVVSIVADDIATRAVMLGDDGVIPAAAAGTVIIDCSTNTPAVARTVAEAARARGSEYLDAPVTGSVPQARAAELVFIVGGTSEAIARARPVFEAMGRTIHAMGPSGSGATMKLVNNMLSGTMSAALAETVAVAEAAGLDPDQVQQVLSAGPVGSRLTRTKVPKMTGRDFSPQFQLALMEKDLRYFLGLAEQLDRPTPIAALVRSQYQAARRSELGELDVAALYQHIGGKRAE